MYLFYYCTFLKIYQFLCIELLYCASETTVFVWDVEKIGALYYEVWHNWGLSAQSYPIFPLTFLSGGVIHDYECVPKATRIIQDRSSDLILCPGTKAQENILLFTTQWPIRNRVCQTLLSLTSIKLMVWTILGIKRTCPWKTWPTMSILYDTYSF